MATGEAAVAARCRVAAAASRPAAAVCFGVAVGSSRPEAAACYRVAAVVEAVVAFRSAPHRAAVCACGSARSEAPAAGSGAGSDGSSGPRSGPPCLAGPAALGVAAAAWSPARFCPIGRDTSRLSGLPRQQGGFCGPTGLRCRDRTAQTRRSASPRSRASGLTFTGCRPEDLRVQSAMHDVGGGVLRRRRTI